MIFEKYCSNTLYLRTISFSLSKYTCFDNSNTTHTQNCSATFAIKNKGVIISLFTSAPHSQNFRDGALIQLQKTNPGHVILTNTNY